MAVNKISFSVSMRAHVGRITGARHNRVFFFIPQLTYWDEQSKNIRLSEGLRAFAVDDLSVSSSSSSPPPPPPAPFGRDETAPLNGDVNGEEERRNEEERKIEERLSGLVVDARIIDAAPLQRADSAVDWSRVPIGVLPGQTLTVSSLDLPDCVDALHFGVESVDLPTLTYHWHEEEVAWMLCGLYKKNCALVPFPTVLSLLIFLPVFSFLVITTRRYLLTRLLHLSTSSPSWFFYRYPIFLLFFPQTALFLSRGCKTNGSIVLRNTSQEKTYLTYLSFLYRNAIHSVFRVNAFFLAMICLAHFHAYTSLERVLWKKRTNQVTRFPIGFVRNLKNGKFAWIRIYLLVGAGYQFPRKLTNNHTHGVSSQAVLPHW